MSFARSLSSNGQSVLENLPNTLLNESLYLAEFIKSIATEVILPICVVALSIVGSIVILRTSWRILVPKTVEEIYRDAVNILKKDGPNHQMSFPIIAIHDRTKKSHQTSIDIQSKKRRRKALNLLRKCIALDPTFLDAHITLATELLHGTDEDCWGYKKDIWDWISELKGEQQHQVQPKFQNVVEECLFVVERALRFHPKDEELDKLKLEAMAILRYGRVGTTKRMVVGGGGGSSSRSSSSGNGVVNKMISVGNFGNTNLGGGSRVR